MRRSRDSKRDDERDGLRARRGEVADVYGSSAEPELAPRQQVETKVHTLNERILGHDEPIDLRCVVLDALHEPEPLELGEKS